MCAGFQLIAETDDTHLQLHQHKQRSVKIAVHKTA